MIVFQITFLCYTLKLEFKVSQLIYLSLYYIQSNHYSGNPPSTIIKQSFMLMLKRVSTSLNLMTKLCFMFNQPPRDPSVPTQSDIMLPYSINFLHDNKGAVRYPKQVGRGPGSGKGKTAGRGHKGQLARKGGKVHPRFEGGQTPITRRLPKYGRVVKGRPQQFLHAVNISQIDYYIKKKVIDPTQTITIKTLVDCGLAKPKKVRFGIKVLARGIQNIDYPLNLQVTDASKSLIETVQQLGGTVKLIHRTPLKLRQHIFPQKYPLPLAEPITPWWKVQKLLRKQDHRGIPIQYNRPKWMQQTPIVKKVQAFTYPIPRDPNPQKVRKRRPKLFKKIDYGI